MTTGTTPSAGVGVSQNVTTGQVRDQFNIASLSAIWDATPKPSTALKDLPEILPEKLPPGLHEFRDPEHPHLLERLQECRMLLLTSYEESAGYAAAYALAHDARFHDKERRALCPSREPDRDRSDLHLATLADDAVLDKPQVLIVEIGRKCTMLDSVLNFGWTDMAKVRGRLEARESFLIFSVDEDLVGEDALKVRRSFPHHAVSHLRYLLEQYFAERADELETRIRAALATDAGRVELRELYQTISIRLAHGAADFDDFLRKLEQDMALPAAARRERMQTVRAQDVFREESEVHRTATFVATFLPDLGQRDFERFVSLLLGEQTITVEQTRQVLNANGVVVTVRDDKEERWTDRWLRNADGVFHDSRLCINASGDGSWIVDFTEPYLRRELRAYFERHYPWYVRQQCQVLQRCGILFALDLAPAAVEGLVRLFVERAVVDPTGFGSGWLLDLVRSVRLQISAAPPADDSPEATLAWVMEQLVIESRLRAHFHDRLGLLIREMLDREGLRPTVRGFFESLINARQHEALLHVILDLAPRLRFVQHFDPLYWMRRLLNEGSDVVRERTAQRLIAMARDSGPRIYEFLADIRKWLPDAERPDERFSPSQLLAIEFPFLYCAEMAALVANRLGEWPSAHPLFYALPNDPAEARAKIGEIAEWVLDPRGAVLEDGDGPSESPRGQQGVRIGRVGELIEHWAWVLMGRSADGPPEGRAVLNMVIEEIQARLSAAERSWLQRGWQQRQAELEKRAKETANPERSILIARKAKLDELRMQFANLRGEPTP